jgi:lysophospholipase L1-like esterase
MARASVSVALVFVASACGSSSTSPTPPGLAISCPVAPAQQSTNGKDAIVSYGLPAVSGGTAPLGAPTCAPASGATFAIGSTPVTCSVTDAVAHSNSCTFSVTVTKGPTLAYTRFFAFGDSITAGEVPSEGLAAALKYQPRLIDFFLSYPTDLGRDLAIRYQAQAQIDLGVQNQGVQGETTANGLIRLPMTIAGGDKYQVMLLMEGANDLGGGPPAILPGVQNVQYMIEVAKNAGLKVILGNLPPQNPNACTGSNMPPGCVPGRTAGAPYVTTFNGYLPGIATAEGVPFVDVYTAFHGDVTTLIDTDGLHPTAAGYQTISTAFMAAIEKSFEVPATTSSTFHSTFFLTAPRRR